MKIKRVYMLYLAAMAMMLMAFGGIAAAQDTVKAFCGNLSETDCQLIQESNDAMSAISSASTTFSANINMSNIPDLGDIAFVITGDANYAADPVLIESMMALQSNPMAMMADSEAYLNTLTEILTGIDMDLNVNISLPPFIVQMAGIPGLENIQSEVRLVDGLGYIDLTNLAAAMPDAGLPSGWIGVDLTEAIDLAAQEGAFDAIDSAAVDADSLTDMYNVDNFTEFLTLERVEDTVVNGQPAAVIEGTFDYAAFFNSDMFQQIRQQQIEATAQQEGEELSADDMAQIDEAFQQMSTMMEDVDLVVTQVIGLEDKYNYSMTIDLTWDMTAIMQDMAATGEAADGPAPVLTVNITAENSNFNEAMDIVAPENAIIIPLNQTADQPAG